MSSAIEPVQPRDERGFFLGGGTNANPTGTNQYSPGFTLKRRLKLAIEHELDRRPDCVTSFAKNFCTALKHPRKPENLAFLRLCQDRISDLIGADESQPTSRLETEGRSEATWLRLAEEFGSRHAEPAGVVIETDPLPGRGAE